MEQLPRDPNEPSLSPFTLPLSHPRDTLLSVPIATWPDDAQLIIAWPSPPPLPPLALSPASTPIPLSTTNTPTAVPDDYVVASQSALSTLTSPSSSASPTSSSSSPSTAESSQSKWTESQLAMHRRVDAKRREKQRVALLRLEALCTVPEPIEETDSKQQSSDAAGASSDKSRQNRRKRHKLTVLEASAARIERLERLLQSAEINNRRSEAHIRALSTEVGVLVTRERHRAQWIDSARTLHTSRMDDRYAFTLIHCRTGRLLEANTAFFTHTGFTPSGVLQRHLHEFGDNSNGYDFPLMRDKRRQKRVCAGEGAAVAVQWVPLRPYPQYPSTLQLMGELMTGQRDYLIAPLRCRWADGCGYEVKAHMWIVDKGEEWVCEADGRRWQRPLTLAVASPSDGVISLDDE